MTGFSGCLGSVYALKKVLIISMIKSTSIVLSNMEIPLSSSGSPKQAKSRAKREEQIDATVMMTFQMYIAFES